MLPKQTPALCIIRALTSSFIVLNQVQNGVAVYATWGTLFTLLNLTIYLQHQTGTSRCDCAMLSLMLLLMKLLAWWVWLPAAFCHIAVGGFFFLPPPSRDDRDEQRNSNLLSSSPSAPRFLLENFYLDEHVRYIVTIYPVVILWLTGTLSNSISPESDIYIFAGSVWHSNWGKLAPHTFFRYTLIHTEM